MNRSPRTRRRAGPARAALVAVVGLAGLLAAPGAASAATGAGDQSITPILDCLRKNADGTYTAVLGYTNSARTTETIPLGTWNKVSPAKYDGKQPTSFSPGTKHGALTVTITSSEYMGGPYWYLDGSFVFWGWAWTQNGSASTCPPSTELPADGNDTGPAIVLVGAGVVGAVALHRARRRALGAGVRTEEDRDDA